jgi:hypothetical protein
MEINDHNFCKIYMHNSCVELGNYIFERNGFCELPGPGLYGWILRSVPFYNETLRAEIQRNMSITTGCRGVDGNLGLGGKRYDYKC